HGRACDWSRVADADRGDRRPLFGYLPQELAFDTVERDIGRPTQSRRVPRDRFEHRLNVRRRARDYLQDLRRGRLLLEGLGYLGMGLGERSILLLQFREQPDVLDGDDGLVSERLQKLDLFAREGSDLRPPDDYHAEGRALTEERRGQDGLT